MTTTPEDTPDAAADLGELLRHPPAVMQEVSDEDLAAMLGSIIDPSDPRGNRVLLRIEKDLGPDGAEQVGGYLGAAGLLAVLAARQHEAASRFDVEALLAEHSGVAG